MYMTLELQRNVCNNDECMLIYLMKTMHSNYYCTPSMLYERHFCHGSRTLLYNYKINNYVLGGPNFEIDTDRFVPGPHTLDITVSTLFGQSFTRSIFFIVEGEP